MTRKALNQDVVNIQKLINSFADSSAVLPRSLIQIYDNLRDFSVIEKNGEIIACCALHVSWDNLAEIRSLVVKKEFQKQGLGKVLVDNALKEAKELGITQVFALTAVPDFFSQLGFKIVDKSTLPHKIWSDCINCTKFTECDEVAMLYNF